jgi:hypothetical protein
MLSDTADRVLVTLQGADAGSGPTASGLREVDNGAPQPTLLRYAEAPDLLSPGPPGYVFGNGAGFFVIRVDADGVSPMAYQGLIDNGYAELAYADGLVFTTLGAVVDVSNPAAPMLAGTFPVRGLVLPLPKHGEALMLATKTLGLASGAEALVLHRLSIGTFSVMSSVTLPGDPMGLSGSQLRNLVRIGTSLAFVALSAPDALLSVFVLNDVAALSE